MARPAAARLALLGVLVGAYFVLYPEDCTAVLRPIEKVLGVSYAVSPWLYAVLGVGIIAWTVVRLWGGRPGTRTEREMPRPLG
jgi:hypothetical protein